MYFPSAMDLSIYIIVTCKKKCILKYEKIVVLFWMLTLIYLLYYWI